MFAPSLNASDGASFGSTGNTAQVLKHAHGLLSLLFLLLPFLLACQGATKTAAKKGAKSAPNGSTKAKPCLCLEHPKTGQPLLHSNWPLYLCLSLSLGKFLMTTGSFAYEWKKRRETSSLFGQSGLNWRCDHRLGAVRRLLMLLGH